MKKNYDDVILNAIKTIIAKNDNGSDWQKEPWFRIINGTRWVRLPASELAIMVPTIPKNILTRRLAYLCSTGILRRDNLNNNKHDRAFWYSINQA